MRVKKQPGPQTLHHHELVDILTTKKNCSGPNELLEGSSAGFSSEVE
jgi:hypothetical protein